MSVSVTAMPGDFYIAAFSLFFVGHWALTKRGVLTFGKSLLAILPSVFTFLAETREGEGGSCSL